MKLSSANINVMMKACRRAAKTLIRDFGEIESYNDKKNSTKRQRTMGKTL